MAIDNILLDTNAYASFKRGKREAIEIIRHVSFIALNSTVLGELLSGFVVGSQESLNRQELEQFIKSSRVNLLTIDHGTAEYYANIYKGLKQKGRPVHTNDMWIAATAIQHNLSVFTYDEHFEVVDGVRIGKCLADFVHS